MIYEDKFIRVEREENELPWVKIFSATKINIASFGNYVPHVHIHVIARFENDAFFPDSVWASPKRKSELELPKFDEFAKFLEKKLRHSFE